MHRIHALPCATCARSKPVNRRHARIDPDEASLLDKPCVGRRHHAPPATLRRGHQIGKLGRMVRCLSCVGHRPLRVRLPACRPRPSSPARRRCAAAMPRGSARTRTPVASRHTARQYPQYGSAARGEQPIRHDGGVPDNRTLCMPLRHGVDREFRRVLQIELDIGLLHGDQLRRAGVSCRNDFRAALTAWTIHAWSR